MTATVLTASEQRKSGVGDCHGYPPDVTFIVRAPSMKYSGLTQTLEFVRGEARAPAIGRERNQQAWNRGERLSRLKMAGYAVYAEHVVPARSEEPMWASQIEEEAVAGPSDFEALDFGVDVPGEPASTPTDI